MSCSDVQWAGCASQTTVQNIRALLSLTRTDEELVLKLAAKRLGGLICGKRVTGRANYELEAPAHGRD